MNLKLSKTEQETISKLDPKEVAILLRKLKNPVKGFERPYQSFQYKDSGGWVEIVYLGKRKKPSGYTINDIICENKDKLTIAEKWVNGKSNLHAYTVVKCEGMTRNQRNTLDHFIEATWDIHASNEDIETLEDYESFLKITKADVYEERPYKVELISPIPDVIVAEYWKMRYTELSSEHEEMRDRLKYIIELY